MRMLIIAIAAALLQGCGTVHNTMRDGDDERVMLRGNDPVSYVSAYASGTQPLKGDASLQSVFDGDVYRFASEANKRIFDANPQKYAPAWAGFCASGVHYALKAAIHADLYMVYKGRLYLFGSERSKANWLMDADENIRLGDEYWQKETREVPFRLQNMKRLVFKVAHYKTDRALDAEHLRRFGKLPPGAPPPR
ncbi:MAG: YHS domain-containing (seleno)protein [Pseudomonadota bacterium]